MATAIAAQSHDEEPTSVAPSPCSITYTPLRCTNAANASEPTATASTSNTAATAPLPITDAPGQAYSTPVQQTTQTTTQQY